MRSIKVLVVGAVVAGAVLGQAGLSSAYRATPNTRLTSRAATPVATQEVFDPALFLSPTMVTNQWTPFTPGTQLVFEARSWTTAWPCPTRWCSSSPT